MFYAAETWDLNSCENSYMEKSYYKAMKMASPPSIQTYETQHSTLEKLMDLPSYDELMASKRLNFSATILGKNDDDTMREDYQLEKAENSTWFKKVKKDMDTVGIENDDDLVELRKKFELKSRVKEKFDDLRVLKIGEELIEEDENNIGNSSLS